MRRYFIVFYTGSNGNQTIAGQKDYDTSGCYLNYHFIKKDLESISPGYEIVLTNIVEVSAVDYKTWTDKSFVNHKVA